MTRTQSREYGKRIMARALPNMDNRFDRVADITNAAVVIVSAFYGRLFPIHPVAAIEESNATNVKIEGTWFPISSFSQFAPGMKVEAWCQSKRAWRPAQVEKPEPYPLGGCDGAYIYWMDLKNPRDFSESSGGWCQATGMRKI
jgi:hypothetical protein